MNFVRLNKKTAFRCDGKIKVHTPDGKVFYQMEKRTPFNFNLPGGVYHIEGNCKQLKTPINYKFKGVRKVESNHPLPKPNELVIQYGDNPNKASIFVKDHFILIDKSYKDAPKVIKDYLIAHEIGHYRYKTERYADEFAQEVLLKKGYPLSLIVQAAASTLMKGNDRIYYCFENMKNTKKI